MRWHLSDRYDPPAVALADRHYNRQKPGTPQFVPPGRNVVFVTEKRDAVWTTLWQKPEFVKHAWPGAWVNSIFRNESEHLSSELIREALAATRAIWGDPPALGCVTFIDEAQVRPKRDPGYCYLMAGFIYAGRTKGGLLALHHPPGRTRYELPAFPKAEPPHGFQYALDGAA